MQSNKEYLTEKEVAQLTGIALSTLRNGRHLRKGFPYIRVGKKSIRYSLADIKTYMESRKIQTKDSAE